MSEQIEDPHGTLRCSPPEAHRRRWRGALWVCPKCGQGYVSRLSREVPGRPLTHWQGGPVWDWWAWPINESNWNSPR